MKLFSGLGVALVTPFNNAGAVDFACLTRLLEHVTAGGVDYLVVMGTTAEAATLSADEKRAVLDHCLAFNNGRLPIVYGVGGNNTLKVIDELRGLNSHGISAILSVVPYYNKPTQAGMYAHYKAILEASPLPVILYNVPGRTGVNMSAETTLRLAHEFPERAVAIKEASGNLSQIAYILRDKPADFTVISGDDNLTLPTLALGGEGVISVSGVAFPERLKRVISCAASGDYAAAAEANLTLHEVTDLLFAEGNPAGVKSALKTLGVMGDTVRLPLVSVSENLAQKIGDQIKKFAL